MFVITTGFSGLALALSYFYFSAWNSILDTCHYLKSAIEGSVALYHRSDLGQTSVSALELTFYSSL